MPQPAAAPLRLSLAAPAYNEGGAIEATVLGWLGHLRSDPRVAEFEIVVCDDGSTDDTGAILERLSLAHAEVRPIRFERNVGAAAALRAAIAATRFEWVLLIDSDGQFLIEDADRLMDAALAAGAAAAIGVRRKKDSAFARFGSWSSGAACNLIYGTRLADFNSAFKLVEGERLRGLRLEARRLNYSTEITARLLETGAPLVEAVIGHAERASGRSSLRAGSAVQRLLFVLYLLYRRLLVRWEIITPGG